MNVKHTGGLDSVYNFETFFQSFILLFQMMTSAGWDSVLSGLMNEKDCDDPNPDLGLTGNCGNQAIGITFILGYLVISFLIVINMYIAVILENYSQATEDVEEGLTDDDYDMYYEIWQQFDPKGTQFVPFNQLSEFLDILEPPLQIHKPNKYKIISMDLPICKGDLVFCVDVLDALTKDFFARKGNNVDDSGEMEEIGPPAERPGYEPVSSTLWRQREEYCARLIQQAWRRHRQNKDQSSLSGGESQEELKQADTAVLVDSDGHVTKNSHKVVIHSRSPSQTSRSTDVWGGSGWPFICMLNYSQLLAHWKERVILIFLPLFHYQTIFSARKREWKRNRFYFHYILFCTFLRMQFIKLMMWHALVYLPLKIYIDRQFAIDAQWKFFVKFLLDRMKHIVIPINKS